VKIAYIGGGMSDRKIKQTGVAAAFGDQIGDLAKSFRTVPRQQGDSTAVASS
jgi:hypothetical protein